MSDSVRLALIGCGGISGQHVKGYRALFDAGCREFVVTACCDILEERAAERAAAIAEFQGTRPAVFTETDALVDAGVADAADLCLPHYVHHTVALQLFDRGIHALVEKPVGITVKASKAIIAAAEQAGCMVATAENIRRYATARSCAWALNERKLIGDVLLVNIQSINSQEFDYTNSAFKWRGLNLLTGGGMIMDSGAHFADMIQVLFGDVDEVYCTLAAYDHRPIEDAPVLGTAPADVEDTWHAVIRFKSGLHVSWTYSRSLHGPPVKVGNYYGSEGTLSDLGFVFHPFQGGGQAVLADGTTVSKDEIQAEYMGSLSDDEKARLFPYGVTDGFAIEVWDFVNAVATGRRPEMDGTDGLRAKTLCECCYESAALGAPVKYDAVLSGDVCVHQRPIDEFWQL